MNKSTKYLIWGLVILVVVLLILAVVYADEIRAWFGAQTTTLVVIVVGFVVGWCMGRFGGRRRAADKEHVGNGTVH